MTRRFRYTSLKLAVVITCVISLVWLQGIGTSFDVAKYNEASLKHVLTETYRKSNHLDSINISDKTYDTIFKSVPLSRVLSLFNLDERCDLYFKTLVDKNPKWLVEPNKDFKLNRKFFKKYPDYEKSMIEDFKKKQEKEDPKDKKEVDAQLKKDWKKQYDKAWANIIKDEQKLHDYVSHIKIYNKCFVEHDINHHDPYRQDADMTQLNDTEFVEAQKQLLAPLSIPHTKYKMNAFFKHFSHCTDLEAKLYPWLTSKLPTYKRWDNTKLVDELPSFKPLLPAESAKHKSSLAKDAHSCFLNQFKNGLNGKGIVLTIDDEHTEMAIRLIRLLRALGNELPIEIIFLKELSFETKYQLVQASRSDFKNFPKQELWFVDVSGALNEMYADKFSGFGHKILATLFNSFDEMILLDADTVLLEKPEFFFKLKKYVKTGTMFYKDRSAVEYRPKNDILFFKKMLPSLMDTIIFNIPQITDYTLKRKLFQGTNHYMESGLVVINRKVHFSLPLMMAQLNFYLPVQARVYGDKELFWLALAMSGNENYAFNNHFAAAIGNITPDSERAGDVDEKSSKTFRSKEVCSNHPAHINDEDNKSLLWFNSGYRHCGQGDKVDFKKEFNYKKRYTHLKKMGQFKAFFNNKVDIKYAVIPPSDTLEANNDEDESNRSWINLGGYCNGYTWCGYSLIGGKYTKDGEKFSNRQDGVLIKFSDPEIRKFNKLGDVWVSKFDFRSPGKVESDKENAKKNEGDKGNEEKAILKALELDKFNSDSQWWVS